MMESRSPWRNRIIIPENCEKANNSSGGTFVNKPLKLHIFLEKVFSVYLGYEGSRKTDEYGDSNPQYVLRNYQHEHWLNIMNYTAVG